MGLWQDITGVTAAQEAGAAQTEATQAGIDFQREMLDQFMGLASPYVEAGTGALQQQQALAGLLGPEAQAAAISGLESSPAFQSALQQGETSILQNAAATGGVRGGNTQGVLAQYAPQLLSQEIANQYNKLGGIAGMGQSAAMGVGNMGMQAGQGISNSLSALGQQQASGILGEYNLQRGFLGDLFGGALGIAGLFV